MSEPLLTALLVVAAVAIVTGAGTRIGAAAVTGVGHAILWLVRGTIQLMREFRAFLKWRKQGGQGPASPGPGTTS